MRRLVEDAAPGISPAMRDLIVPAVGYAAITRAYLSLMEGEPSQDSSQRDPTAQIEAHLEARQSQDRSISKETGPDLQGMDVGSEPDQFVICEFDGATGKLRGYWWRLNTISGYELTPFCEQAQIFDSKVSAEKAQATYARMRTAGAQLSIRPLEERKFVEATLPGLARVDARHVKLPSGAELRADLDNFGLKNDEDSEVPAGRDLVIRTKGWQYLRFEGKDYSEVDDLDRASTFMSADGAREALRKWQVPASKWCFVSLAQERRRLSAVRQEPGQEAV